MDRINHPKAATGFTEASLDRVGTSVEAAAFIRGWGYGRPVNDSGRVVGESHHRAKLTDHDVDLVRDLRDVGLTHTAIAAKFDVSRSAIQAICSLKRRGHLAVGHTFARPVRRHRFRPAHLREFDCIG